MLAVIDSGQQRTQQRLDPQLGHFHFIAKAFTKPVELAVGRSDLINYPVERVPLLPDLVQALRLLVGSDDFKQATDLP